MNNDFVSFELAVKLKEKGFNIPFYFYYRTDDKFLRHANVTNPLVYCDKIDNEVVIAPTISQVLKWLREEKNIDIEIHADVGMLGIKVYSPYISTYTEFTLETSPEVIRYRQNKFSPTTRFPHEIIPAHVHFEKWEQAAITGIEYVLNKLIL